jgi:hypothetical protein
MAKDVQEIDFNFGIDRSNKFVSRKPLPTVKSVCVFEILVVPDLKAMRFAIKNHVAENKKAGVGSQRISGLGLLTEFLTKKVLIRASEINLQRKIKA